MTGPVHVTSYIDASYGVHTDSKSHTGCIITLGKGAIYSKSATQKLNALSSTEAVTEGSYQVFWTRYFLMEQGYRMQPATMFQDKMSTIQLLKNGKSNAERTMHIALLHHRQDQERGASGHIQAHRRNDSGYHDEATTHEAIQKTS